MGRGTGTVAAGDGPWRGGAPCGADRPDDAASAADPHGRGEARDATSCGHQLNTNRTSGTRPERERSTAPRRAPRGNQGSAHPHPQGLAVPRWLFPSRRTAILILAVEWCACLMALPLPVHVLVTAAVNLVVARQAGRWRGRPGKLSHPRRIVPLVGSTVLIHLWPRAAARSTVPASGVVPGMAGRTHLARRRHIGHLRSLHGPDPRHLLPRPVLEA